MNKDSAAVISDNRHNEAAPSALATATSSKFISKVSQ